MNEDAGGVESGIVDDVGVRVEGGEVDELAMTAAGPCEL